MVQSGIQLGRPDAISLRGGVRRTRGPSKKSTGGCERFEKNKSQESQNARIHILWRSGSGRALILAQGTRCDCRECYKAHFKLNGMGPYRRSSLSSVSLLSVLNSCSDHPPGLSSTKRELSRYSSSSSKSSAMRMALIGRPAACVSKKLRHFR